MKSNAPNICLISGSGRNSGKTTLAVELLKQAIKLNLQVITIKVTNHTHNPTDDLDVHFKSASLMIAEEKNMRSHKDSSLMLQNGAQKSYYIECKNSDELTDILSRLEIDKDIPVICESNQMHKVITPGVHLHLNAGKDGFNIPNAKNIESFSREYFSVPNQLLFNTKGWILQ